MRCSRNAGGQKGLWKLGAVKGLPKTKVPVPSSRLPIRLDVTHQLNKTTCRAD
jgi:hypothetical protein